MARVVELRELRQAADDRHRDPSAALAVADRLRDAPEAAVRAWARWVAGLACFELGRPDDAVEHYGQAIEEAIAARDVECEARARSNLAISLLNQGLTDEARDQIDRAVAVAPPDAHGQVQSLLGLVEQRAGSAEAALRAYAVALPALEADGQHPDVARLRLNRGTLLAYTGRHDDALEDLSAAESIAEAEELWVLAAMAAHNTSFALGRDGRIVDALAAMQRAETAYHRVGDPHRLLAVLEADRCELLVEAGLLSDGLRSAAVAVDALDEVDEVIHAAEARVLGARAALGLGRLDVAAAMARAAAAVFRDARRTTWLAWAEYLALRVDVLATQDDDVPPPDLGERALAVAAALEEGGLRSEALHARTLNARLALSRGEVDVARGSLEAAAVARRQGTAATRAQAWLATALLRLADDDRRGARQAIDVGLRIVEDQRSTMGSTELRAASAAAGDDLARLGVRLALDGGRPSEVFVNAERWRAGALRTTPRRVLDDEAESRLRDLQRLYAASRAAELAGDDGPGDAEVAALERQLRRLALSASGEEEHTHRLTPDELRGRLGDRVLVELVELDRVLWAVVVRASGMELVRLGSLTAVAAEVDHLLFALRRLAREASPGQLGRRVAAVEVAAGRVGEAVLGPLGAVTEDEVVIVPTGSLHAVPWMVLPSLHGRAVTVAPSARLWARDVEATGDGVAVVCGPDLPAALAEVQDVRAVRPDASIVTGAAATRANLVRALEHSDVVHLAAHGVFRADSPMFTSFRLADGPVTLLELERVAAVPRTVVLPACDAGVSSVRSGDELIGAAAALLQRGVREVIAPMIAVPDDATSVFTIDVHRALAAGRGPARAVADAGEAARQRGDGAGVAVAAAFVCLGSDERARVSR